MDQSFYFLLIGILLVVVLIAVLRKPAMVGNDGEAMISKALYNSILSQNETLRSELVQRENALRESHAQVAARDQNIRHLEERMLHQKTELDQLQKQFSTAFENVANRLLEEKSERFNEQQNRHLQQVLLPLREKIKEFEENVDRKFLEDTKEKVSLKKEIEQLRDLNVQLSQDAHNLTSALKGQSKVQGNWGEYQLEILLEKAGLQKGVHFVTQNTFRDDDGAAKRPDFIIQLPENRQLILDAKVSLTAYEQYHNENDPQRREVHLKAHIDSIRRHVNDLSSKNYQLLYQINSPDYLLLFIPLESALSTASQADPRLFTDALERNIVLVSSGSLLATLRTVAHLWKQEKQTRSVLEIARQSGLLYDKFVAFVEDLRNIGSRLDAARNAYDEAMNKMVNSPKRGDTLVGRAEKIRELGARATKALPADMVEEARENQTDAPALIP